MSERGVVGPRALADARGNQRSVGLDRAPRPRRRMIRTHTCGALRADDDGKRVTLQGWVHRRRDHGGLIFIDLRDRYGLVQITVQPGQGEAHSIAEKARAEYV